MPGVGKNAKAPNKRLAAITRCRRRQIMLKLQYYHNVYIAGHSPVVRSHASGIGWRILRGSDFTISVFRAIALHGAMTVAALVLPTLDLGEMSWRYGPAQAQAPSEAEKSAFNAAKELGTVEAWNAFRQTIRRAFMPIWRVPTSRSWLARRHHRPPRQPHLLPRAAPSEPAAHELPCTDATKIRSERSDKPAKIRFVNEFGATLIIQWIDFKGALKEYGELRPGAEMTQDTFITHPWIAAYQEGSCRQMFLPGDGVSIARLLPEGQLPSSKKLRGRTTMGRPPSRRARTSVRITMAPSACAQEEVRKAVESDHRAPRQSRVRRHGHDLSQRPMRAQDEGRAQYSQEEQEQGLPGRHVPQSVRSVSAERDGGLI